MLALIAFSLVMTAGNSLAQSGSKPLNLGGVLQTKTKGAPPPRTYLKLPKEMPLPKVKASRAAGDAAAPAEGQMEAGSEAATPSDLQAPNAQTDTPAGQQESGQNPADASAMQAQTPPQPAAPKIEPGGIARLQLAAFLTDSGQPLQRGMNWRIFEEKKDAKGQMPMVHNSDGGALEVELKPGRYIIYAGYGFANLTKRVILAKAGDYSESFVLRAGGMRLNAIAAGDITLDSALLSFNIYTKDTTTNGTQELIAKDIMADHVVRITEGTYHVVSSYGDANAKVRGDVEIKAGELTSVTMIHNAAKVTLRLVSEPGGEALANTVWTVLTPGGDLVKRAIGAFPTLALASGDYTAIAKQGEEIYNRDFSVDAGLDRDIEVLAKLR
ncbi:MAG: hypothetical protein N4A65_12640 [Cohaesibacter sp.]|nr:hypothetical protein [Cohaesibacter sp.]